MNGEETELPEDRSPYPIRPGDAPFKALEKWLEIDKGSAIIEAKREIKAQAIRKLEMLDEMHQDLIRRAYDVLEKAREDLRLHDIRMNAAKVQNHIYYLYRHPECDRDEFFSILEPSAYLKADTEAEFLGVYLLNEDNSWTLVKEEDP